MKKKPIIATLVCCATFLSVCMCRAHEPEPKIEHANLASRIKVLVYSNTAYYRHPEIPAINRWLVVQGNQHGMEIDVTEHWKDLQSNSLQKYDVLVFNNANQLADVIPAKQRKSVEEWFASGKGIVGLHATLVMQQGWPWLVELGGCDFNSDSDFLKAKVIVDSQAAHHPAVKGVEKEFWYTADWTNHTRPVTGLPGFQVLLRVDEKSYEPVRDYFRQRDGKAMGDDHPIAWTNTRGDSRFFYTELGHDLRSLNTQFGTQHVMEGIRWAANRKTQHEGKVADFLNEPKLDMQATFKGERFPNIAVATDGTLVATWGTSSVRARRSEDGGSTWGNEITIAKSGFQGGGLTVDERSGAIFAFVEEVHPPAELTLFRSTDQGKTWQTQATVIQPDKHGNTPSMHMNDHGITLRHGPHHGRLIRPTRWYAGKNDRSLWPKHYTNAIYSDDAGKSWKTSDPFPENGTGEACIVELSDGRLYYNSRVHWQERPKNTRRRCAFSSDGGHTWTDWRIVDILPDGPQDTNYGCMAGLCRLPIQGRDILIYSNCESPSGRKRMTVWTSFDGGETWPIKRLVFAGKGAYSSMIAGRPNTPSQGSIYLHFEGGPKDADGTVARFNLSWILGGTKTGNGSIPAWAR